MACIETYFMLLNLFNIGHCMVSVCLKQCMYFTFLKCNFWNVLKNVEVIVFKSLQGWFPVEKLGATCCSSLFSCLGLWGVKQCDSNHTSVPEVAWSEQLLFLLPSRKEMWLGVLVISGCSEWEEVYRAFKIVIREVQDWCSCWWVSDDGWACFPTNIVCSLISVIAPPFPWATNGLFSVS